jgi:hypothetical protein
MEKTRQEIFHENRPAMDEQDALDAARQERVVTSFNFHPVLVRDGIVAAIAIKWVLGNGNTETVLIDRFPAEILRMLFEDLNKNNWTGTILVPPDATRQ